MLIVLAIVGLLARSQLHAARSGLVARSGDAASQTAASAAAFRTPTVADQARDLEQKARDDVERALQQGADRNAAADQ